MPVRPPRRAVSLAALLLAACAPPEKPAAAPLAGRPAGSADSLPVIATLTYRERVSLGPEAKAHLEIRPDSPPGASVAGAVQVDLAGRQVPIVVELRVDRARLDPAQRYVAQGGITEQGRPVWVTEEVPVDVTRRGVELGTLVMTRYVASGFQSALRCGDQAVTVGFRDDVAVIQVAGESFELKQVPSASGARFEHPSDPATWFWSKGGEARLAIRGHALPTCRPATGTDVAAPFRARGNEPFWSVELSGDRMTFRTPDGAPVVVPQPAPETIPGGTRWTAATEAHRMVVTSLDRRCVDDMSGMPSPKTVTLSLDGKEYRGCGGEPAALLEGEEWVVEDLDRAGIIDRSRVSLRFGPGNRLAGRAGCNTYTGSYALTGESLTVSEVVVTQVACSPALAAQEARFLEILRDVHFLEFTPDGALVLKTVAGRSILARR